MRTFTSTSPKISKTASRAPNLSRSTDVREEDRHDRSKDLWHIAAFEERLTMGEVECA
jgi:hypothetical protein